MDLRQDNGPGPFLLLVVKIHKKDGRRPYLIKFSFSVIFKQKAFICQISQNHSFSLFFQKNVKKRIRAHFNTRIREQTRPNVLFGDEFEMF